MRLKSTLLSRARLAVPFSVESRGLSSVIFHAVVAGECWIRTSSARDAHHLVAGDVAIVGKQQPHVIAAPADGEPISLATLSASSRAGGVPLIELGHSSSATRIVCGTIELGHPASASLASLLPPLLPLRAQQGPRASFLRSTLALLEAELDADEPGVEAIATRLVDSIVVMAIRRASLAGELASGEVGWLAAATDPHVGKAIALIHERAAHNWTAAELAAEVGLSRSKLYEQFSRLVGEPPARYLGRWRVYRAAELLGEDQLSVLEVAERVGYSSEDALSRAFKRFMGATPSQYRRALVSETVT